jgi:guanine deaminase
VDSTSLPDLPARPPFAIRARVLTPLAAGGSHDLPDGLVEVDERGCLGFVGATSDRPDLLPTAHDLRDLVVMPGLVDLHAHLPQLPNAGLGAGLDLLTWLERCIFPLERAFDAPAAERLAPAAWRAFAAAGSTTVVAYSAVYAESTDVSFRAAEAHGIRAVIGQVLMDRERYDRAPPGDDVVERSIRESADLCERWHGRDEGRLRYAVTPRFAVACSAELLRASAELAAATGAYWQTHVSEDRGELAAVAGLFPEARDYLDVYDRAGGLTERAILAHAIHLSDREVERLAETGAHIAHCPSSNLFLASGMMPLARYLERGLSIGIGSDVAAGPELSLFSVMRVGASTQNALRVAEAEPGLSLEPLGWLRLATLGGAQALGLADSIGSLEPGKEADLIAVDAAVTAALPDGAGGAGTRIPADPADLVSRLMFRTHPAMVRASWVRGRRLAGPAGWEPDALDTAPAGPPESARG